MTTIEQVRQERWIVGATISCVLEVPAEPDWDTRNIDATIVQRDENTATGTITRTGPSSLTGKGDDLYNGRSISITIATGKARFIENSGCHS